MVLNYYLRFSPLKNKTDFPKYFFFLYFDTVSSVINLCAKCVHILVYVGKLPNDLIVFPTNFYLIFFLAVKMMMTRRKILNFFFFNIEIPYSNFSTMSHAIKEFLSFLPTQVIDFSLVC